MGGKASRVGGVLFIAAALLAAAGLVHARGFYHDDAYITLRYVQRFLAGRGVTWNDGERVAGFTHPLWLAQIALLGALRVPLPLATRLCGVAYLVSLFALWWRARAWPLPLLLVATQPALIYWALGGLETAGIAFWLAAGAWLVVVARERVLQDNPRSVRTAGAAGAAFAAAALMRPEGLGAGLVALVWLATARRRAPVIAMLAALALPVLAYVGFSAAYFGDYLPNTARAKIGGLPLGGQLRMALDYLAMNWVEWAPGLGAAIVVHVLAPTRRLLLFSLLSVPVWASLLLGGGDHMAGARLVVPVVVVLAFGAGLAGRPTTASRLWAALLVGVAAAGWQFTWLVTRQSVVDAAAVKGEVVGRFLEAHLPPGATVSTATAGSTAYFAPSLCFIDSLGLNDRRIAARVVSGRQTWLQFLPGHQKGDGAYVLSRAPEVVVLGPAGGYLGANPRAWFLTDFELLSSPQFRARYLPYLFRPPIAAATIGRGLAPSDFTLTAYLRGDSVAVAPLVAIGTALPPPWETDAGRRR